MKIDKKRGILLGALSIPVILAITFGITYVSDGGVGEEFNEHWKIMFLAVLFIVIPLGLLFMTTVEKSISKLLRNCNMLLQKLFLASIMASIMVTIVSAVVLYFREGYHEMFISNWHNTIIVALPFAILMGFFMSSVVMPRVFKYILK